MIANRDEAREALRGALEVRRSAGVRKTQPVIVYDLAHRLQIEVRFAGGGSFGGMYERLSQTILVPSLRPPGRRAFSCAHEMGHWHFEHGTRVDSADDFDHMEEKPPDERLANLFAGFLLMPPWAVEAQFAARGWLPLTATPLQIYVIAGVLGVGYATLAQHLCWSMRVIDRSRLDFLLRTTPKRLRRNLLGHDEVRHAVIADGQWPTHLPIDLQVGEGAIVPADSEVDGACVEVRADLEAGRFVLAVAPGVGRIESARERWAVFTRVSRQDFIGRSIYRHLEANDVDTTA